MIMKLAFDPSLHMIQKCKRKDDWVNLKMMVCVSQRWVEVDGVMSKALRGFIAFPTATLEGLSHTDLCPVPVFSMVLNTIHILKEKIEIKGGNKAKSKALPERKNLYYNPLQVFPTLTGRNHLY